MAGRATPKETTLAWRLSAVKGTEKQQIWERHSVPTPFFLKTGTKPLNGRCHPYVRKTGTSYHRDRQVRPSLHEQNFHDNPSFRLPMCSRVLVTSHSCFFVTLVQHEHHFTGPSCSYGESQIYVKPVGSGGRGAGGGGPNNVYTCKCEKDFLKIC
jgi:hypothetical protein